MAKRLPDRWLNYTSIGAQVEGTPFVPLKVPLKKAFFKGRSPESFTPADVRSQLPNLGMMIDLTYTTKYYSPVEFNNYNIQHKKLLTKGHEIPQRSLVDKFIEIVNQFLSDEQNKDKQIGVHCTHGLNRTGYFVCAYMILEQGRNPRDTINVFNKARFHKMERANYLNSLMTLNSAERAPSDERRRSFEGRAPRDSYQRNDDRSYHQSSRNGRYSYAEGSGNWRRDSSPRKFERSSSREHREIYRRRDYDGNGGDNGHAANGNSERPMQYEARGQRSNQYRWSREEHH
ncbi:RNA/RNP complex-1-interacting phosphatase homolog isoform X1 [Culex quinquefasciatus]|uniref:RNA/RNP complex-1-interacting phosphatase homolog isoform X1 n=2 Tax=Culex quinquefasciatus TaxID=7176 RepID=UPI0018E34492|nr:RNA/RNP complex-1-interacting phosphatase homolog isoform X1 [Culex quinquefasciatus]